MRAACVRVVLTTAAVLAETAVVRDVLVVFDGSADGAPTKLSVRAVPSC